MAKETQTLSDILKIPDGTKTVPILIDGDIVAFRAAAVTNGNCWILPSVQNFQYKKDAVQFCKDNNFPPEDLISGCNPEPEKNALAVVKTIMDSIRSNLTRYSRMQSLQVFLTDPGNFRYDMNPGYKSGRKGNAIPEHLAACKKYLRTNFNASSYPGLEADDMLTIAASESASDEPIIVSIDKDLRQKSGLHYDFVNDKLINVSKAQALHNLWVQVIAGDTTDSIYSPRGLGKVAGQKLYPDVSILNVSKADLFEKAVTAYMTKFKGKDVSRDEMMCWVKQTFDQVYLLRSWEEYESIKLGTNPSDMYEPLVNL